MLIGASGASYERLALEGANQGRLRTSPLDPGASIRECPGRTLPATVPVAAGLQ